MTKAPLWILAAALVGAPASAQFSQAELVRPAEAQDLNGHLARLAANPRDVTALIGAGEAALALDDPQAAAGFFARADAIESGNGRIKAGQGRVMLAMQNPAQALMLFDQATRIGYNAANFASYRALARDLTGDQAGAQEDYRTALKAKPDDPELIRRYAASLGISGQVDAAEQVLKPLLYKSDRAAWRYRAFILAMNNRQDDARKIAEQTLPAQLATGLVPYLQKMPYLTGAQKAAAVHLGHFPARIGTQIAAITPTTAAPAAKVAEAAPTAPESGPIRRAGVRRSSGDDSPRRAGDRRRKRDAQLAAAEMPATPAPAPVEPEPVPPPPPAPQPAIPLPSAATAVVQPLPEKPAPGPVPTPEVRIAAQDAAPGLSASTTPMPAPSGEKPVEAKSEPAKVDIASAPVVEPPASAPRPSATGSAPGPAAIRAPSLAPAVEVAMAPRREVVQGPPAPAPQGGEAASATNPPPASQPSLAAATVPATDAAPVALAESATAAPSAPDPEATRSLADIIRAIDVPDSELRQNVAPVDLAEVEKLQIARRAAQEAAAEKARKAAAAKAKAEADAKAKAEAAEKKRLADNPSRNWVQVGIGQSRSALGFTMKKLRAQYSALAPQDAWAASWGRTNRLLVGPFVSFARAKAVEEELKAKGADVFAWQSKAGEQVDRIGN